MRRIVYRHTTGPWIGLRQLLALEIREDLNAVGHLVYLHTGEGRILEPGPLPDRLTPIQMPPDGRLSKALRLKTTDKYVLYNELPVEEVLETGEVQLVLPL